MLQSVVFGGVPYRIHTVGCGITGDERTKKLEEGRTQERRCRGRCAVVQLWELQLTCSGRVVAKLLTFRNGEAMGNRQNRRKGTIDRLMEQPHWPSLAVTDGVVDVPSKKGHIQKMHDCRGG